MKIGSIFSGIGGLEKGLEMSGVGEVSWQIEIDPACRRVLAKHWPNATRFDDVTEVDFGELEKVQVICGGFPCQDVSNAGLRAGLAGARSGLWGHLLRAIRVVRPLYAVVENVAALLARGMGTVLGDLAESGYDAEWDCIPAAAVGAPHCRDRVFLVAYANGEQLRQQSGWSSGQGGSDSALVGFDGAAGYVADPNGQGKLQPQGRVPQQWGRPIDCGWWSTEPDVARVAYGIPGRLDRERMLGNAVVPWVARHVGNIIVAAHQAQHTQGDMSK